MNNHSLFNIHLLLQMVTDFGFGYHSELSVRYHVEAGNPVWYYRLGYLSEEAYKALPRWMGKILIIFCFNYMAVKQQQLGVV